MQFRVLGPLEVEHGRALVALGGPKERAALAVLALRAGHVVSAESLIDAVWGEDPPRTAAKTLQTYIFRLRRTLAAAGAAEILVTRGAGYVLQVAPDQVDATRFERLLADARQAAAASDPDSALAAVHKALALWRGDPLAELSFSPALVAESTRLSELRLAAVEQRVELELAAGRHNELVGELRQLISEYPLREGLWGSLMLALYRCGRQADALRAYQGARAVLIEELGVEPGPALRDIERRILDHDADLAAAGSQPALAGAKAGVELAQPPLPAALSRLASIPVVGRATERERLAAAWSAAITGARRAVLLAGEPGIGKTALAAALARDLHATGAMVLYGRCDEEAVVPYQPFVEALRDYVAVAPVPVVRSHLSESGGVLSRVLPDLRRRVPGFETAAGTGPGDASERHLLFDAVASLLTAAARQRPLLLVLDDLHWADQATLLLLRHVLRDPDPGPLAVVGTYRDTQLGRSHPLAESLALMRRDESVERLALTGLDVDAVTAMVTETLGSEGDWDELAARIADETAGNPLFVREVVRHLAESQPGAIGDQLFVPEGVQEVIGRRVARLSDDANDALAVAAVVGLQFEVDVVAEVARLGEDRTVSALEEAAAAGLVLDVDPSGERYEFAHAVVRRSLYEELSSSRRVRTHRRVAAVLERLDPRRPGSRVAEIAHHLAEAAQRDDVERAAGYCRAAGDAALAQLAYEEAARHYRRALEMLDLDESASDETRAEVLLALGDAVSRVDPPTALEILEEAAGCARLVGSATLLARAALATVGTRTAMSEPGRESVLLDEALAALPDDDPLVVRLLSAKAQWLCVVAPAEVLSPLTRRAIGLARRIGDPSLVLAAAVGRMFALADPADSEERLALSNEILRAEDACPPAVLAIAHRNRAQALFERRSHEPAWESVEEHRRLAERSRHPMDLMIVAGIDVMKASMEGRFGDADACLKRVTELANRAMGPPWGDAIALGASFSVRWLQGRLPELHDATEFARRMLSDAVVTRTGHAVVLAASGRTEEARALVREAVPGPVSSLPRNRMWSLVVFNLSISQGWVPEAERAGELYDLLHPYEHRDWVPLGRTFQGCFAHHLGVLAGVAGDLDLAVGHLDDACARYRDIGAAPWTARAEEALAEVLVRRRRPGDREAAAGLLASAAATTARLGMRPNQAPALA